MLLQQIWVFVLKKVPPSKPHLRPRPLILNLINGHLVGKGVPKDEKLAVVAYKLAAEAGYGPAQFNLGICYEKGLISPLASFSSI